MGAPTGALCDVLVDLRPDEPTYGQWVAVDLAAGRRRRAARAGRASPTATRPSRTTPALDLPDQRGPTPPATPGPCAWDDPTVGIDWPLPRTRISDKDREGHPWPPRTDHRGVGARSGAGCSATGVAPVRRRAGAALPTSTSWCPARPPTSWRGPRADAGRAPGLVRERPGRLPLHRRQRPMGRRQPGAGRGRSRGGRRRVATGTAVDDEADAPRRLHPVQGRLRGRACGRDVERGRRCGWLRPFYVFDEERRRPAVVEQALTAPGSGARRSAPAQPASQAHDFVHAADVGRAIVAAGRPTASWARSRSGRAGCTRSPSWSPGSAPAGRPTRTRPHPPRRTPTETADITRADPPGWAPTRTEEFFDHG